VGIIRLRIAHPSGAVCFARKMISPDYSRKTITRMSGRDTDMKMAGPFRSGHFNF
jgi:hypothetical protein